MKAYEGVQAQFHSFSTLELGGEGSATLPLKKIPGWLRPSVTLDILRREKSLPLSGFKPQISLQTSHYTNCAISAPLLSFLGAFHAGYLWLQTHAF